MLQRYSPSFTFFRKMHFPPSIFMNFLPLNSSKKCSRGYPAFSIRLISSAFRNGEIKQHNPHLVHLKLSGVFINCLCFLNYIKVFNSDHERIWSTVEILTLATPKCFIKKPIISSCTYATLAFLPRLSYSKKVMTGASRWCAIWGNSFGGGEFGPRYIS